MRKLPIAIAVCALAVSLTAATAVAKKGPKNVVSTVTLVASPTTIEPTTTTVAASGNVKANSSCRKNRTVRFSYTDSSGAVTALPETALTKSNGDYSVTLQSKPTTAGPVTLVAAVDEAVRNTKGQSKGKGKKKGHKKGKAKKFICLGATAQTALTVN